MDSKLKAGLIKKRGNIRIWNTDNWDLPLKARWASQQWRSWEWRTKNSTRWASIYITCAIGTLYLWWKIPGSSWRWHSQGMGKYFVTLAKQVGYERTILLLGRHLRFQSIGIRMLTIITTKSNRYFFSKWQKQLLQHFSSIFHNKCSPQRLLPEPRQPPWLLEVHIPKGKKTKKKR